MNRRRLESSGLKFARGWPPILNHSELTNPHDLRYIAATMERSLTVVFSVLVSALLGLFALLADSYFQTNPVPHGKVTDLAIEKRVP